jgi:hypothetical protein
MKFGSAQKSLHTRVFCAKTEVALKRSREKGLARIISAVVACLMALLVLGAAVGAVSPSLHNWIHSGAGQPGHECAITLFQQNQLLAAEGAAIAAVTLFLFISFVLLAKVIFLPIVPSFLPPGRAPPAFYLSPAVVG